MKKAISMLLLAVAPLAGFGATPAQEKAFVDAYKKAFEAKDEKALHGFLYTKGADAQALEFYKMMMTSDMGGKITSIQLADLNAEDKKRAQGGPGPDGVLRVVLLSRRVGLCRRQLSPPLIRSPDRHVPAHPTGE